MVTSLVPQGITPPTTNIPPPSLSPSAVHQGLPGMTTGQYTLNNDLVYPRQPPETPGIAGAEPPSNLPSQPSLQREQQAQLFCSNGGWVQGTCDHGTTRWLRLPCKKRGCPICGQRRRNAVAKRIAHGIAVLGGPKGAAWFVGTFATAVEKKHAVKIQGKFLRWLRQRLGPELQYAATWETTRSGRLHLNLLLAPWSYIPQAELSHAWQRFGGGRVSWIQRVGQGVGVEAAKSRHAIAGYMGKWEQMVVTGRMIAYSKAWPKPPTDPLGGRQGHITWHRRDELSWEVITFEIERDRHLWRQAEPGEWRFTYGEECDCFTRESLCTSGGCGAKGDRAAAAPAYAVAPPP